MFETRSRARRARVDATLRKRSGPRRLTSPHNSSAPHHTHPLPAFSQLILFIMIFQWLADRALRFPFLNYLQGCLTRSESMQVPTVSSKSRGKSRCVRDGLTSYELLFTRIVSCPLSGYRPFTGPFTSGRHTALPSSVRSTYST